ncbi:MAG TPA: hypothetical protein VFG66_10070 [Gemmatimonadales bacterium]|nr:hypothetical protein [Gemmatimonadales bacterium]
MTAFRPRWTLVAGALVAAACSSNEPTPPTGVDCSGVSPISLAVGAFTVLDASQTACVRIPAAGASETEHLYVALATEGQETKNGVTATYELEGGTGVTATVASPNGAVFDQVPTAAASFHDRLRARERNLSEHPAPAAGPRISASVVPTPPVIGSKRTFDVCATTTCDSFVQSHATAKVVAQRVAIFVDDSAPAGGYSQTDLDQVGALFDSHLYPIDTTAFGRESDLDDNGVVVVLLTPRVNELSPNCNASNSVILGYFFGLDLLPSESHSNDGEIFYGVTPGSATPGCTLSTAFAKANLPSVFVHEFQHMISFNQHVLVRHGTTEDVWLNEGLSHFAEELAGRQVPDTFCPDFNNDCGSQFIGGNLDNAFKYLEDPEAHFAIEPSSSGGTLEERGANWLLVRWLADHFAASQPLGTELTRALVQTALNGSANVAAVTGETFGTLVSQWQMANDLDDLPGFTPASDRLQYSSFDFRGVFQANFENGVFDKPYPLTPDSTRTGNYSHSGVLRGGSGKFLRIIQPAGAAEASFVLSAPGGDAPVASSVSPRIAIVRVR